MSLAVLARWPGRQERPARNLRSADGSEDHAMLNAKLTAVAAGLSLLAGCSSSQRVVDVAPDFKCPKPGTQLTTSIGGEFIFTSGDGYLCRYQMLSGYAGSRYAMLVESNSTWMQQGADKLAALWPLKVGNQAWFVSNSVSTDGYPGSWYETYTVTGRQTVTTPAGRFDTYVIEWEETGREGNGYRAKNTYYFAPSFGYFVKFEPDGQPGNKMQPWIATRVEIPAG
jgi:hypothetical protein